jgi:hypothetical protein
MSDNTTTDGTVVTEADNSPQPEETIEQSAESLRSDQETGNDTNEAEPSEDDNSEQSNEETKSDVDLKEWARKKGIDPEDPEAILKLARDTEKGFRQYSEKAKQESNILKEQVTQNSDLGDAEAVIQEARVINFYNSNPDARSYDKQMGEIYGRFVESDPEFASHLMKHLDTLYAMAKTESSTLEVQEARQQGKIEALEAKKKAQMSSAPSVNASSSAPPQTGWTADKINQVIENGEYEKHREEILAWERSQY